MDEVEDNDDEGSEEESNHHIPTFSYKRRSNNHYTSKTRLLAAASPDSAGRDFRNMSEENGIIVERRKRTEIGNPTINMVRAFSNANSWTGINGGFASYTDMIDPHSPKSRNRTTGINFPRLE